MANRKKWIQDVIKRPGALTKKAKKAGAMTEQGTIKKSWINKVAANKGDKYSPRTEDQAELAQKLRKWRKK